MLRAFGDQLDEDYWLREALFFVVASANTTTHAVPHVFTEILSWAAAHPSDAHLLADDAHLRHACEEGLRLHGPVPALLRRALRDVDDLGAASGEDVGCLLHPANTDPDLYGEDAGAYDPRRGEHLSRMLAHGLSFGAGPHICSGRPLAMGLPPDASGRHRVLGVVPRLVRELLDRGAQPDPDDPPTMRGDTNASRYATHPLVFTAWSAR